MTSVAPPLVCICPPFSIIPFPCRTHTCSPASSPVLLQQQNQPASAQRVTGRPPQQRPPACGAHARLSGRVTDDDDPGSTVAFPKLTTRTCLLHTRTGEGGRGLMYMETHLKLIYFTYFSSLSTVQRPMWPPPSSTQSKQATRVSTQPQTLQNMVLMVRGSAPLYLFYVTLYRGPVTNGYFFT